MSEATVATEERNMLTRVRTKERNTLTRVRTKERNTLTRVRGNSRGKERSRQTNECTLQMTKTTGGHVGQRTGGKERACAERSKESTHFRGGSRRTTCRPPARK